MRHLICTIAVAVLLAAGLWPATSFAADTPEDVTLFPRLDAARQPVKILPRLSLDVRTGLSVQSGTLHRFAEYTRDLPVRVGTFVGPELTFSYKAWAFELWPRFQYEYTGDFYEHMLGLGLGVGASHRWVLGWNVLSVGVGLQGGYMFGDKVTVFAESYLRVPFRWAYYFSEPLAVVVEVAPSVGLVSLVGRQLLILGDAATNWGLHLTCGGELSVGLRFP